MYQPLEKEIQKTNEWWKDKLFEAELDRRFKALESGIDKGFTLDQFEASIAEMRKKRYRK